MGSPFRVLLTAEVENKPVGTKQVLLAGHEADAAADKLDHGDAGSAVGAAEKIVFRAIELHWERALTNGLGGHGLRSYTKYH
jgi:hypothetical protein